MVSSLSILTGFDCTCLSTTFIFVGGNPCKIEKINARKRGLLQAVSSDDEQIIYYAWD